MRAVFCHKAYWKTAREGRSANNARRGKEDTVRIQPLQSPTMKKPRMRFNRGFESFWGLGRWTASWNLSFFGSGMGLEPLLWPAPLIYRLLFIRSGLYDYSLCPPSCATGLFCEWQKHWHFIKNRTDKLLTMLDTYSQGITLTYSLLYLFGMNGAEELNNRRERRWQFPLASPNERGALSFP